MQTVLPQFQHIYIYLSVPPFHIIIVSIYDFTPMIFTVPMWGSEIANSKDRDRYSLYMISLSTRYGADLTV